MQAKKKNLPVAPKKPTTKKKSHKISNDHYTTVLTTKQKTFATLDEPSDIQEHKNSARTTHHTSRRDCLDRMEANKLSPFSSPGKSVSPRQKKSISPMFVKQKQIKKNNKMQIIDLINKQKKNTKSPAKSTKTTKNKNKNTQKVKAEFQNQFLKRMHKFESFHEKKITELSEEEMEASLRKISKPTLTNLLNKKQQEYRKRKSKKEIIKEMHTKIKQKCRNEYPNLDYLEVRAVAAIILIQKLWKQSKVKSIISQFLSPRNLVLNHPCNQTFGKLSLRKAENPRANSSLNSNQIQNTMKTQKSFSSLSPKSLHKHQVSNTEFINSQFIENKSDIFTTPEKGEINLKELQISDEFTNTTSEAKVKQFSRYVEDYREVVLKEIKDKKKKKLQKPNAFNFPQSLSQKCLLQNLYKKRVTKIEYLKEKKEEKVEIINIFLPSKSSQKSKEQYISPKKPQIVELEQRFYTQAQDQEYVQPTKIQKQPLKPEEQTIGSIGNIASKIIQFLVNQFSQQFQAFSTKKCLKKKKRLPGIPINDKTVLTYLNQFVSYVKNQHSDHFQFSFTKINAGSFLKIFRVLPQEDIFQPGEENQEEDLNYPILPNLAFFEYQPIYEQKIFQIREQDKKYSNFLSGLIKIHNKCLVDCLSEYIEKQRIESIEFPWDVAGVVKSQQKIKKQVKLKINDKIEEIKKRMVSISNTRLGKLYRKDVEVDELNLLASLKQDYRKQGKDWSQHQDLLQLRLEIAQLISQQLFQQLAQELP